MTGNTHTLPDSWSALTWDELRRCWDVKMRYGGNANMARVAALLMLVCGEGTSARVLQEDGRTGETVYVLTDASGCQWKTTARELAFMAEKGMKWFDYPYGDPGEDAVKDDKGKVIKESRPAVRGYVSAMRDAMVLPEEYVKMGRRWFALPQVAGSNLTWQQYRSLQAIAPRLFAAGQDDSLIALLQAQFLAHILVPRSFALFDTAGGSIKVRPHYEYRYDMARADELVRWWEKRLADDENAAVLFHICFQVYQTALTYYAAVYPVLFSGDGGKADPLRDALTGEVGTVNTVMKYAGYSEQQQVYDSNLPFVFDILNTMTKEAKEIERVNARIKKK